MNLLRRVLWFVLLLALIAWFMKHVPGEPQGTAVQDSAFDLWSLFFELVNPIAFLIAAISAVAVGRLQGLRSAARLILRPSARKQNGTDRDPSWGAGSKTLTAAARGLVWGSFLLHGASVLAVYFPDQAKLAGGYFSDPARVTDLRTGGLFAIVLGVLVLQPMADQAQAALRSSPTSPTSGERIRRSIDAIALLGLFACTTVLFLGIFFMKFSPRAGASGGFQFSLLTPTFDGLDWQVFAWSAVFVASVPWLALAPVLGPFSGRDARRQSPATDSRDETRAIVQNFARLGLATGVLGALLIGIDGLNRIAIAGGNADPAPVRALVGRMLVPLAVGCLITLLVRPVDFVRSIPAPSNEPASHSA